MAVIPHADGSVSVDDRHTAAFDARFLYDVADPDLVARCIQEIASAAS